MRAAATFVIAAIGFISLLWAMHKSQDKPITAIAFGLYALIFAFGVAVYGNFSVGSVSQVNVGPSGVGITLAQAQQQIRQTGTEAETELRGTVANLRTEVDGMRQQLNIQTQNAQKTLDDLKAVESRLSPRRLSPQQKQKLVARLHLAGHQTVDIVGMSQPGDYEMLNFARQIRAAIIESGWTVKSGPITTYGGVVATGVNLWVKDPKALTPAETVLKEALIGAGLNPYMDRSPDGSVIILIGSKNDK